jgi:hypothetical protein
LNLLIGGTFKRKSNIIIATFEVDVFFMALQTRALASICDKLAVPME